MSNINNYQVRGGRMVKEDGTIVNMADMLEALVVAGGGTPGVTSLNTTIKDINLPEGKSMPVSLTGSLVKHEHLNAPKPSSTRTYYGVNRVNGSFETVVPVDISGCEKVWVYFRNNMDAATRNGVTLYFYDKLTAGNIFWGLETYSFGDIAAGKILKCVLVEDVDTGLSADIIQIPKRGMRGIAISANQVSSANGTVDVLFIGSKPYVYGGGA